MFPAALPESRPSSSAPSRSLVPASGRAKRLFLRLLGARQGGVLLLLLAALCVGLAVRGALLAKAAGDVSWDASLLAAFAWGAVFDLAAALWWAAPLAVLLAALPARFFAWRVGRIGAHALVFSALYLLLFGAVAEWLFWDEFGVRFNFIAVDYLVYTTEVIGNIRESYSMPLIFAGLGAVALAAHLALWRAGLLGRWLAGAEQPAPARWRLAAGWCGVALALGLVFSERSLPEFANTYNRELGKSGLWSLFAAFRANQLDYDRFYPTLPADAAFQRVHAVLARDGSEPVDGRGRDLLRRVRHAGPEQRLNVIQITVESLSADFLARYGNTQGLTPNLDALMARSLVFDRLYATGTRTDRGMEALTLSVPPTPGRSLVKRPQNERLFTLGSVFRQRGYDTAFVYGGFGYFDNMNYFFGENGYRVVDRTSVPSSAITFANVWGACDEDLFRWTLAEADRAHEQGTPFFHFVMTTSNHRPFTYPEGRIDLPSKISGRSGGVKYTDYAIGEFLRAAAAKPWFTNTVFVIVADHCASSAGKAELPAQNYHIPMIVYAPGGQVAPGVVDALASQIDYAPTLLGLLGWSYPSRFFGLDVLRPGGAGNRALIGNYQKLGLLAEGRLGVLKPMRQAATYRYDEVAGTTTPAAPDPALIDDAIAYYQVASEVFKTGRQREYADDRR
jgi:arylsulfatase A-like enzyme